MATADDFEAFVREHQDMVYTTALRLLGRPAEAEDMAQEAFVRAFERREELAAMDNAGGWLRTVTTNLCLNHLERHRKRWTLFSEVSEASAEDSVPFEETIAEPRAAGVSAEDLDALENALLALPEAQRVPLALFHFEDLGYEDIAARLGVTLAKVKTDMHRGRAALRKALEGRA
jgi:RNA polymerase sigma-70 factor (ECF subfamily)